MVVGDTLIKPLPSNSGLYYQKEGELVTSEGSWKLIIYRNLEPLTIARDSLKRLKNSYFSLIARYPKVEHSQTTTSFININIDKINERLSDFALYNENPRSKRAIIDGLGSVLKWLIGTPDAKDAQYYEDCIEKLEKQEIEGAEILNQQMQIISSTLTNFNDTITKISYDEHIINENLYKIQNYLNTTTKAISELSIREQLSEISIQILESILTLEQDIDDVLTSILFVRSGALHPSIISTERLYRELSTTSHARTDKTLVLPVTMSNVHKILDSSTLSAYIYMNKLTYILDFPLIRSDRFTIYHLYSIPIRQPNSTMYSTILPEQTYLATNPTRQQYVSINTLNSCKTYAPEKIVCESLPVYNYNTRPICEMAVLMSKTKEIPTNCVKTTFAAHINTFQAIEANKWIFILRFPTPCVLQCGDKTTHHEIKNSGVIELPRGCKLYTAFVTLSALDEKTTNITHPIITVNIEDNCSYTIDNSETPDLIPLNIDNVSLDSLNTLKEELNHYSEKLKKYRESTFMDKHSSKFSTFTIIIGMAMMIYLLYKCCYKRRLLRRILKPDDHQSGCVQIFNNCFDNSRRRHRVTIPMTTIATSSNSDDESSGTQRSAKSAQPLF